MAGAADVDAGYAVEATSGQTRPSAHATVPAFQASGSGGADTDYEGTTSDKGAANASGVAGTLATTATTYRAYSRATTTRCTPAAHRAP